MNYLQNLSGALLYMCPFFIVLVNEDGTVKMMNEVMLQALGYSEEEVEGVNYIEKFVPPSDQKRISRIFDTLREGNKRTYNEGYVLTKNSEKLLVEWHGRAVLKMNGDLDFILCLGIDISQDKEREEQLQKQRGLMEGILNEVPDILAIKYPDLTIERLNRAGYDILGMPPREVDGKKCYDLFKCERVYESCATEIALETKKQVTLEKYSPHLGRHFYCRSNPLLDEEGNVIRIIQHLQDITQQKIKQKRISQERDFMFRIFESMKQYILVVGKDYTIEFLNRRARTEIGELEGGACYKEKGMDAPCPQCPLPNVFDHGNSDPVNYNIEFSGRILEGSATPLINFNGSYSALLVLEDVTKRKKAEEKVRYLSFHDSFTGLYNRIFLEEEMERLDTERQLPITIIMGDLNGLKLVNDVYGHSVGDEMLLRVGKILKKACRKEDIIARWGGDEFVILLPQTSEEQAHFIRKRIMEECKKARVKRLPISLALGVASKNSREQSLIEVLKEAEDRMYDHKLVESRNNRSAVLEALLEILREKTLETKENIDLMKERAMDLGRELGLPPSELERLSLLVTLYDIGKITVPDDILRKETFSSEEEGEIFKKHPETGYRIARSMEEFVHVADDILHHHENWDGSGYPRGLKGEEIPLLARIIAVIDAYQGMVQDKPWRKALAPEEALDKLKEGVGSRFDPQLVSLFLKVMAEEERGKAQR